MTAIELAKGAMFRRALWECCMAYEAKVVEIMIASPSDVGEERQIAREIIGDWNALHARERQVVLLPTGWDTHSSPDLGGRPQQLINERILAHCDVVIGLFWTRIGTATGKAASGTVEEIQDHHSLGKPVMLYFSNAPIPPDKMDADQFGKVQELKRWAFDQGIVGTYDNLSEFRTRLLRDLHITLRDNPYLKAETEVDFNEVFEQGLLEKRPGLSPDALELLREAISGKQHLIFTHRSLMGTEISAGERIFCDAGDAREVARWRAAVEEIHDRGMSRDINGNHEIFEITHAGYKAVEG